MDGLNSEGETDYEDEDDEEEMEEDEHEIHYIWMNQEGGKTRSCDTGTLPFARVSISVPSAKDEAEMAPEPTVALLDSGASIGLCQKSYLESLPVMPEIHPTKVRASAFTGSPISICGKTRLLVDFGIAPRDRVVCTRWYQYA